ncbi:M20 family metallopeptidase [Streptomyces luteolus]|uniref:Peptidase M20 domain-containing protein 2 n=1 Tax=Streptomyces luteolus TaxID=3043615 RepID=A0ABT6SUA4_9ACTN|nr:M20 family metallopeptidase [Streptomyces sp. B-S-A12]MDI3419193.1 M20 family metallopeptidase [Streptomyces sp. B-S-A12]
MPAAPAPRDRVAARIDAYKDRLVELSHALHDDPETAFEETRAAERVAALLEEAGFTVRRGACELPTALTATYGTGDLTIGVCAEYDALPELGHACGHNVICAAGVGAAIALTAVADELGFRVKLLGTPAEEEGGGKVLMLERGAFDDVTVAMMVHPEPGDAVDPRGSSTAVGRFEATFTGRAAHAASAPEAGLNAADAAVVAQVAIGQLRQQLRDGHRVAGIVRNGGERTNIIPERTVLEYEVRTPTGEELQTLRERVLDCFRGAALATGTTLDVRPTQPDYVELRHDPALMQAYARNLRAAGRDVPEPGPVPRGLGASTDMGNVAQALPAIHPGIGIDGAQGTPHTRQFAVDAASPAADEAALTGALAMAWTGLDLAADPDWRARALAARRA